MRSLLLAAASALVAAQTPGPTPYTSVCHYAPSSIPSTTFDVCALAASTDYTWTDPSDFETTNSTYTFNIGVNVQTVPSVCVSQGVPTPAPAYQVTNNGGGPACYALGRDLGATGIVTTRSVYDPTNPAKGWILTYLSGSSSGCANGRTLSLIFLCSSQSRPFPPPGAPNQPLNGTFINEVGTCGYEAWSISTYGCPLECPRVGGKVCGGNGVCGYDSSAGQSRCFCYDNWIESDCQTPRYPFPGGAVAGATIGGIILGALVLLGVAYLYRNPAGGVSKAAASVDGFYA